MDASQETHPEPSYPPSPPAVPTFDPATFVVDDIAPYDPNIFVAAIKHQVHKEIFSATQTSAPPEIVEALSDKLVYGHFKYRDPDTRETRDAFNKVNYSLLKDIQPFLPLTEESQSDQRLERALVLSISTYLRITHYEKKIIPDDLHDISAHAERLMPQEQASSFIVELVHIIYHSVDGDRPARLSAVTKLVAGVPASLRGLIEQDWWGSVGRHSVDSDISILYWALLYSMVDSKLNFEAPPVYSSPGSRWKTALMAKIALWILAGSERNIFDVASRFVDLDFAHNRIESGLALSHPILGSAVVSPMSASVVILYAMAGCVQERKDLQYEREYGGEGTFLMLHDTDKGVNCNIRGVEVTEESMVSMGRYFPKKALANFFYLETWELSRVLISRDGIVLYFPKHQGPWVDYALSKGQGGRDPLKLVIRVLDDKRSADDIRKAIENKGKSLQADWLLDCPVSEETKKRFRYIINKPGRALVRRRGLRGHYGRVIAAVLLVCGATVTGLNFAGRDNWLERAFDGAQVMSLLAAVAIAIIFLLSGTLVETLDLLAGKTEAQDIEHLCKLTGLTIQELHGVLTYARGTLYWLSEHRASYCRATKLGPLVMTLPLNVADNPETKYSVVIDDQADELSAVWVLQGRMSKIEKSNSGDGTLCAVDIPFEQRLIRQGGLRNDFLE